MGKIDKSKMKIIVVFSVLFFTVLMLLLIIFISGKRTYTVTFELDGGTLVSGELVQKVVAGENATPPKVTKDGCTLSEWSKSYKQITKSVTIKAVWDYETTEGLIYSESENQNFTELVDVYEHVRGDVYVGASYGGKKILGIGEGAFAGMVNITGVHLVKGLIAIEKDAFSGCTGLTEMTVPNTVTYIGEGAFADCENLETLVLKEGLIEIGARAFANCTSLREVIIPRSVEKIDDYAFDGCVDIVIKIAEDGSAEQN